MNEEELKKYLKDNFTNYIRESIDSSIIFKYISEIETENKKLNNVIDKLEEYLNKIIDTSTECERITCKYVLQYLQELKGSDKDENN